MPKIKAPKTASKFCPICGDIGALEHITPRETYYLVGHLVGIHDFKCPNCNQTYELNGHIHIHLESDLVWTDEESISQIFEFHEKFS